MGENIYKTVATDILENIQKGKPGPIFGNDLHHIWYVDRCEQFKGHRGQK